jgi:hypothetical protein
MLRTTPLTTISTFFFFLIECGGYGLICGVRLNFFGESKHNASHVMPWLKIKNFVFSTVWHAYYIRFTLLMFNIYNTLNEKIDCVWQAAAQAGVIYKLV